MSDKQNLNTCTECVEEITCKAWVAMKPAQPMVYTDVIVSPPQPSEVRVQMQYASWCGTDGYNLSGADPESNFPVILGHEGMGVVESVGSKVTSVKKGDKVMLCFIPQCKNCKMCASPHTNLCRVIRGTQGKGLMPDGSSRFKLKDGTKIFHFMGCSAYSQYTVLPEIAVAKIRDDAKPAACLLGCGIATGYGSAFNIAKVKPGSTVAVFGCGAVGCGVIEACKLSGASTIIGVDLNDEKEKNARHFGITHFVNPSKVDVKKEIMEKITDGGVDYSFECVGNVHVMRTAFECVHLGWGLCVLIGVAAAGKEFASRPFNFIVGRQLTGSAFGQIKSRTGIPVLVDRFMDGELKCDDYITSEFKFDEMDKVIKAFEEGKGLKSLIKF